MKFTIESISDEKGRITRWPKKKSEKLEVLKYIRSKIDAQMKYTEKQINEIITRWHSFGDHALLRRELFDNYLLERTKDGSAYWIGENRPGDS
jgi:hypothetical protein